MCVVQQIVDGSWSSNLFYSANEPRSRASHAPWARPLLCKGLSTNYYRSNFKVITGKRTINKNRQKKLLLYTIFVIMVNSSEKFYLLCIFNLRLTYANFVSNMALCKKGDSFYHKLTYYQGKIDLFFVIFHTSIKLPIQTCTIHGRQTNLS